MSAGDGPSLVDRVRFLLSAYTTVALVICALLVLGGGYVAVQAHTGPETTTEQRVVGTWTANGSFEHGATVQRDTLAFENGQVLRNRSLYYRSVTPVLQGSYVVSHAGDPSSVSTQTDLSLVIRAVTEDGNGRQVLWEIEEPIESVESTAGGPGQPHRVAFEFNVSEQIARTSQVREELRAGLGETEILLVAETEAQASLAGEQVTQTRRDLLRITPQGGLYSVAAATAGSGSESVTETVDVPVEQDPVRAYGSIVLVLVGLSGGAGLWYLDREGELSVPPGTAAAIRNQRERRSFDEWISHGRVPPTGADERVIDVDSLEDLVDVAIDSDRRVIEDPERDVFAVFDGTTRYRFDGDSSHRTDAGVGSSPETAETTLESSVPEDGADPRTGPEDSAVDSESTNR